MAFLGDSLADSIAGEVGVARRHQHLVSLRPFHLCFVSSLSLHGELEHAFTVSSRGPKDSNSVSWNEFRRCFEELNFHGNVAGAWRPFTAAEL